MPEIIVNKDNMIQVNGALNFAVATKLCREGVRLIAKNKRSVFDLTNIQTEDSSGLALLVAWVKYAHKVNKEIYFVNIPGQLLAIINLCGLDELLPIKK
ncbi:MAG: STAS domain-containing protein [Gammaproteobacteria bacterium]|nr:STAS domain-containing protein [Gammaproteobacteria bacterium]